ARMSCSSIRGARGHRCESAEDTLDISRTCPQSPTISDQIQTKQSLPVPQALRKCWQNVRKEDVIIRSNSSASDFVIRPITDFPKFPQQINTHCASISAPIDTNRLFSSVLSQPVFVSSDLFPTFTSDGHQLDTKFQACCPSENPYSPKPLRPVQTSHLPNLPIPPLPLTLSGKSLSIAPVGPPADL